MSKSSLVYCAGLHLSLLLILIFPVSIHGEKVECDVFVDDYSTLTIAGITIPNPLTVLSTIIEVLKLALNALGDHQSIPLDEDTFTHPVELIRKNGYSVECHKVTSRDGYVTQLFRILAKKSEENTKFDGTKPTLRKTSTRKPSTSTRKGTSQSTTASVPAPPSTTSAPSPSNVTTKYPVFIGHGLLSSAADFLVVNKDQSLPYVLSDDGYEVWLWNARGNQYAQEHVSKNNSNIDYWDFSVHEMGAYDLPAAIDYMLKVTESDKINYVGYSMTSTAFHILMSEREEYNSKVNKAVAMAPAIYLTKTKSPAKSLALLPEPVLMVTQNLIANGEVYPNQLNYILHRVIPELCTLDLVDTTLSGYVLCQNVLEILAGPQLDSSRPLMQRITGHMPSSSAIKNVLHYFQYFRLPFFRQFDYGPLNYFKYGQWTPPEYYLNRTKVDMLYFYGEKDALVNPEDVEFTLDELVNANVRKCQVKEYSHLSFMYAHCVCRRVYRNIIKYFNNEPAKCNGEPFR